MRLLVDESLSHRVAALLANAGHDASHVGDLGLLGAADPQILAVATNDNWVLVTADTDFGDLLAASTATVPSVILLRRPGRRADQRANAVLAAVRVTGDALEDGAIVVVEPQRIRIRQLPIA